jgi:hypothetical protein
VAPLGRFRQLTVTLVPGEGSVTAQVAVAPGATEAVRVVKFGPDPEAALSTSNCSELEVPPPGVGVCTVTAVIPAVATIRSP